MSKYLSSLLGAHEPGFSQMILQLELAAAGVGVDVRLSAEIRSAVKQKIQDLALDPKDTTAAELYHALLQKAVQDDLFLKETVGIRAQADSVEIIQKLTTYFSKSSLVPEIWSLKRTTLKKLLAEHVPHKTMKALRYRSIASLLKRESPACVYAVAMLLEGARYKQKLVASIKHLQSSDFELSRVEFVQFSPKEWIEIRKQLKSSTVPVFSIPKRTQLL